MLKRNEEIKLAADAAFLFLMRAFPPGNTQGWKLHVGRRMVTFPPGSREAFEFIKKNIKNATGFRAVVKDIQYTRHLVVETHKDGNRSFPAKPAVILLAGDYRVYLWRLVNQTDIPKAKGLTEDAIGSIGGSDLEFLLPLPGSIRHGHTVVESRDYPFDPANLSLPTQFMRPKAQQCASPDGKQTHKLTSALSDYGVHGDVVDKKKGPVITLFEFEPRRGTKASKVISLSEDVARSMGVVSARIRTIPGRTAIGVEIPNDKRETVRLGEVLASEAFKAPVLPLALGKAIDGEPVVADLESMPHLLIAGTTGSGKCLEIGTQVLRYDGRIVAVEDVKPGDCLMGPDSRPRRVLSTCRNRGALFRINPIRGEPWVCNDVHILTLVETESGRVIDIPLDEYLRKNKTFKHTHKLFQPCDGVEFAPQQDPDIPGYFLGLWIGDGRKSLSVVAITKPDAEVLEACNAVASKYEARVRTYYSNGCPTHHIVTDLGKPNPLLVAMRALMSNGDIPHAVLTASRSYRADVLAGVIDTDGHQHCGCVEIAQKNRKLADGIAFLARSLGLKVTESKKVVNGTTYSRLMLSGELSQIPTLIARKTAQPRRQKKIATRTGFSVDPIGDGEYAGFELDGDGRFLLGDFTVTHNSVGMNTMILSLLARLSPSELHFVMIDPKQLELSAYDRIPHLVAPVVTDPERAIAALKWTAAEMTRRYALMKAVKGVRKIESYNAKVGRDRALPRLVIVIDELAHLMDVAGKEVDGLIQKLAAMARAAGIHMIVATQRPSVDVITGVIKANFPVRIAYQVASAIDSRVILGESGAEQLLGQGDMLFQIPGKPIRRVHGSYVTDAEIEAMVKAVTKRGGGGHPGGVDFGDHDDDGPKKLMPPEIQVLTSEERVMTALKSGGMTTSRLTSLAGVSRQRLYRMKDAGLLRSMGSDGAVGAVFWTCAQNPQK